MLNYSKRAWTEISLDNLEYNLNSLTRSIEKNQSIIAVVKANAYGHGDKMIALEFQRMGINWFAVSNIDEAISLRKNGISKNILILGYTPISHINELIENNIIQTIYSSEYAALLSNSIPENKKLKVHLKVDTGMSRLGFFGELIDVANEIQSVIEINNLEIDGIYTHLSTADSNLDSEIEFTNNQIKEFTKLLDLLSEKDIKFNNIHIQNSAGAISTKCEFSNLVRYGIALYGLNPSPDFCIDLKPVMALKSVVCMVKTIPAGASVGYSRTFICEKETKIATVPIGYADGYHRLASNNGYVLINGKKANIIGNVCMDQIMLDVSEIDVKIGDEVILFSEQLSVDIIAKKCKTINYEMVCSISMRIPRVYIKNNEIVEIVNYIV